MKLGFVSAVTTAIKCDIDEYYKCWLPGAIDLPGTAQSAAFKNIHRSMDDNDYFRMLSKVNFSKFKNETRNNQ